MMVRYRILTTLGAGPSNFYTFMWILECRKWYTKVLWNIYLHAELLWNLPLRVCLGSEIRSHILTAFWVHQVSSVLYPAIVLPIFIVSILNREFTHHTCRLHQPQEYCYPPCKHRDFKGNSVFLHTSTGEY